MRCLVSRSSRCPRPPCPWRGSAHLPVEGSRYVEKFLNFSTSSFFSRFRGIDRFFSNAVFWPLFISRRDGSVPKGRSAAAERESTRRSENREALLDASSRGSRGDPFEKLCVPLQDPAESLASRPSTIYFHLGPSASQERATASSEPLLPLEHCSPRCPKDRPTGRLAAQEMQTVEGFRRV